MIGRCLCAITYALAFPAPAFVGGRLAFRRVSLAEVWKVLPPDPWFLIPDAPFGLLLAVRLRAADRRLAVRRMTDYQKNTTVTITNSGNRMTPL